MAALPGGPRTHFLTAQAAARHMIKRGSGVILTCGGSGPQTLPNLGGFKVALDAIECLRRQWACELGQYGMRVVTLKTAGSALVLDHDADRRGQRGGLGGLRPGAHADRHRGQYSLRCMAGLAGRGFRRPHKGDQ
jgi:NAD(P)-dependent dehydrogenase (short-subunit alcohol dehydrogenase family)